MLSDLLQTSRYLTCFSAGDSSLIVYAIDELEPRSPNVKPPDGATFGIIGLDRNVVWHTDLTALEALQHAAKAPVALRSLIESYGIHVVSDLIDRGWLQRPDELCTEYLLTTAQIEVTTHCNWGCSFCPVSQDRKPSATMPMPLFEEIIEKISPYDTIRYVTFHFYNEPTLDPFFDERVAVLQEHRMMLRLFTNASHLTENKIETLKRSGVLYQLLVNLPALEEKDFRVLTQSNSHARALHNLDAAIESGLPVEIAVNGADEELSHRVRELREWFEVRGVQVKPTFLSDRAGTLTGRYNQAIRITGPLRGCAWPVNHAHFSVTGDMFICCNDYYQRETFGNIRSGSVHDIMTSPAAVLTRRRVFGVADTPANYLCRSCHDQLLDFPRQQFRPLANFPVHVCFGRQEVTHG